MKRNTGRPPVQPQGDRASITLKVPSELKRLVLQQADAYGMTITEYFTLLVEKDARG